MSQRRTASLASQGSERTITSNTVSTSVSGLLTRLVEVLGMELRRQGIPPTRADWPRYFVTHHIHLLPATSNNNSIGAGSDTLSKYSSLIRRNGDGASRVLLIDLSNEGIDDRYCIALCEALVKLSNTPSYMNALWQQSHMSQYPICWYILLSNNALTSNVTTHLSLLLQCALPVSYVALDGNAFSAEAQQKLLQCAQSATSTEEDGSSKPCRVVFQAADGQAVKNTSKEVRTGVCTPRARSAETPIIVTTTQGEGVEVNEGGALRATRSYSPQHTHNSVTHSSTTASRRPVHGSMSESATMYTVNMEALEQRRAQLFRPTQTTTGKKEAESKTPQGQCVSTPKDIAVHVDPHEPVTPDTTACPHPASLPASHKAQRAVTAAVKEEKEEEDDKGPDVTAHVSTLIDSVLDLASVTDAATGELNEAARTIHGEARTVWDILNAYTGNDDSGSKEGTMANKENMRQTTHSVRETRRVDVEEEKDDAADKGRVDQDVSQLTVSASSVSGLSGGLTSFHSITVLRLNGNYLKELTVLPRSLLRLDISDNALTSLSGLAQCPMLTVLNARRNRLTAITHLEHNRFLAHLFLGRNRIKVVEGLAHMFLLETLDLSHNCIRTPSALRALSLCSALQHLLLKGNPCLTNITSSTASGSRITSNGKGGVAGAQQRHPLYVMLRNLCPTLRKVDAYSFSGHSRYAAASVDHSSDNTIIEGGEKSGASPSSADSTTPNAMQLLRLLTRGVTSSAAGYSEAARSKAASLVHNAALKKTPTQANKKNNTVKEQEESAVPTFRPTFIDDVTEKQTRHKAANVAAAHRSALREHVIRQLAAESQRFLQSTLTERLQPVLEEEVMHNVSSEDTAERSPALRPTTLDTKVHKKNKEAEVPRAKSHSQRHESNGNNSIEEDILRPYVPRPFRPPPRPSRRSTTRNSRPTCEGEQDGSDALSTTPSSYAALHRAEQRDKFDNRAIPKEHTVDEAAPVSYLSITLSPSPSPRRQQSATRATAAPPADYITVEDTTPCYNNNNNREYDKAGRRTGSGSRGRTSRVLLSPAPITESMPSHYANSLRERRVSPYTSNRAPQLSPPPPLPPSHRRLSPSPGQVHLGATRTASHTTSTEPITETLPHKGTSKCTTNKEDDEEECVTWVEELHASVDGVQAALRSVVQLILAQRRHSAPTTTTSSNNGVRPNALEQRVEEQARCIVLERQRCVKLLEASGMLTDTHVPRSVVQRYGFTEAELNGEEREGDIIVTKRVMSSARLAERGDVLRQLHVLADAKTCLRHAVLLMREGREQTLQRYVDQVNDTVYNGTLSAHSA